METQERKGRTPSMVKKAQIAVILLLIVSFFADLFVYLFVDRFTIGYFLFIMFLVPIPLIFTIVYLQMIMTKHVGAGERSSISITYIKFLSLSISLAFFLLGVIQNRQIVYYIFGVITIVIALTDIIKNFTGDTYFDKFSFLINIVLVLALVIYLIASVPEEHGNLKTIVTPIVASVLGSLIALVGVAWTIKHNDLKKLDDIRRLEQEKRDDIRRLEQEKKEDERKRIKPYFSINMVVSPPLDVSKIKICLTDFDIGRKFDFFAELENSNIAPIMLKRAYHDNKWYDFIMNTTVLQGDKVSINWLFDSYDDIYLEVEDIIGNPYYYSIKVISFGKLDDDGREFYTVKGVREVTKDSVPFYQGIKTPR